MSPNDRGTLAAATSMALKGKGGERLAGVDPTAFGIFHHGREKAAAAPAAGRLAASVAAASGNAAVSIGCGSYCC